MDEKIYSQRLPDSYHQKDKIDWKNGSGRKKYGLIGGGIFLLAAVIYVVFFRALHGGLNSIFWYEYLLIPVGWAAVIALRAMLKTALFLLFGSKAGVKVSLCFPFLEPGVPEEYFQKEVYRFIVWFSALISVGIPAILLFLTHYSMFFVLYWVFAFAFWTVLKDGYLLIRMGKLSRYMVVCDAGNTVTLFVRKLSKKGK